MTDKIVCPVCGSHNFFDTEPIMVHSTTMEGIFECEDCGRWFRASASFIDVTADEEEREE